MAITYLMDISNKPEEGTNAIDTRYNIEPNTVDVTSYYNPQGIHFKTNEGLQYGLGYDPQAQKHYIVDPARFYGVMGMKNPYGGQPNSIQPNPIYDSLTTSTTVGTNQKIAPITIPPTTTPSNAPSTIDAQQKIKDIVADNTPPAPIINPDIAKSSYSTAISNVQNPIDISYDKMTTNERLINQQYDATKAALINDLLAGIQKSRSEYQATAQGLPAIYDPLRSQASVMAQQQEQQIREAMANSGLAQAARGVGGSGLNIQLQNMADIGKQQAIQGYNTAQAGKLADINRELANLVNQEIAGTNRIESETNLERIKALLQDKKDVESGNYGRSQDAITNQLRLADMLGSQYTSQQQIEQAAKNANVGALVEAAKLGQTQEQITAQKEQFAKNYGLDVAKITNQTINDAAANEREISKLTGLYKGMPTLDAKSVAADIAYKAANIDAIRTKMALDKKDLDNYDVLNSLLITEKGLSNANKQLMNAYQEKMNAEAPEYFKQQVREMKTKSDEMIRSGDLAAAKLYQDTKYNAIKLAIEKKLADHQMTNDQARIALGYYEANQANYRAEKAAEAALASTRAQYGSRDYELITGDYKDTLKNGFQLMTAGNFDSVSGKFTPTYDRKQLFDWASTNFNNYPDAQRTELKAALYGALGFSKSEVSRFLNMPTLSDIEKATGSNWGYDPTQMINRSNINTYVNTFAP